MPPFLRHHFFATISLPPFLCHCFGVAVSLPSYLCRRFFVAVSLSPYLCRRICAIVSLPPFLRPVAFPARLSRSPTFGRCAVSPHFLLTFRRCAEALPPREPSVASFPHPPYHPHLPKVRTFPTFSTHLPKVRRSRTAPRAACSLVFLSTMPFPPSEGGLFPYIFYSPSEGAQKKIK